MLAASSSESSSSLAPTRMMRRRPFSTLVRALPLIVLTLVLLALVPPRVLAAIDNDDVAAATPMTDIFFAATPTGELTHMIEVDPDGVLDAVQNNDPTDDFDTFVGGVRRLRRRVRASFAFDEMDALMGTLEEDAQVQDELRQREQQNNRNLHSDSILSRAIDAALAVDLNASVNVDVQLSDRCVTLDLLAPLFLSSTCRTDATSPSSASSALATLTLDLDVDAVKRCEQARRESLQSHALPFDGLEDVPLASVCTAADILAQWKPGIILTGGYDWGCTTSTPDARDDAPRSVTLMHELVAAPTMLASSSAPPRIQLLLRATDMSSCTTSMTLQLRTSRELKSESNDDDDDSLLDDEQRLIQAALARAAATHKPTTTTTSHEMVTMSVLGCVATAYSSPSQDAPFLVYANESFTLKWSPISSSNLLTISLDGNTIANPNCRANAGTCTLTLPTAASGLHSIVMNANDGTVYDTCWHTKSFVILPSRVSLSNRISGSWSIDWSCATCLTTTSPICAVCNTAAAYGRNDVRLRVLAPNATNYLAYRADLIDFDYTFDLGLTSSSRVMRASIRTAIDADVSIDVTASLQVQATLAPPLLSTKLPIPGFSFSLAGYTFVASPYINASFGTGLTVAGAAEMYTAISGRLQSNASASYDYSASPPGTTSHSTNFTPNAPSSFELVAQAQAVLDLNMIVGAGLSIAASTTVGVDAGVFVTPYLRFAANGSYPALPALPAPYRVDNTSLLDINSPTMCSVPHYATYNMWFGVGPVMGVVRAWYDLWVTSGEYGLQAPLANDLVRPTSILSGCLMRASNTSQVAQQGSGSGLAAASPALAHRVVLFALNFSTPQDTSLAAVRTKVAALLSRALGVAIARINFIDRSLFERLTGLNATAANATLAGLTRVFVSIAALLSSEVSAIQGGQKQQLNATFVPPFAALGGVEPVAFAETPSRLSLGASNDVVAAIAANWATNKSSSLWSIDPQLSSFSVSMYPPPDDGSQGSASSSSSDVLLSTAIIGVAAGGGGAVILLLALLLAFVLARRRRDQVHVQTPEKAAKTSAPMPSPSSPAHAPTMAVTKTSPRVPASPRSTNVVMETELVQVETKV